MPALTPPGAEAPESSDTGPLLLVQARHISQRSVSPSAGGDAVRLTDRAVVLEKRALGGGAVVGIVIALVIGIILVAGTMFYFVLRCMRLRNFKPKYVPGSKLKSKWNSWRPSTSSGTPYSSAAQDGAGSSSSRSLRTPDMRQTQSSRSVNTVGQQPSNWASSDHVPLTTPTPRLHTASGGLLSREARADRHVSVRSIITLPAYSEDARPSEEILGREGERAGIDTVLEFPETVDEEEERRDEEMESLFQIRQARRAERAARDERRRQRRQARERGDMAVLESLRNDPILMSQQTVIAVTNPNTSSAALIAEHHSKDRGRKISEVSYSRVGVARHDGSRVRADSAASDKFPLLESAESMGGGGRSRSPSRSIHTMHSTHHMRNQSSTSLRLASMDTASEEGRSSDEFDAPTTRSLRSGQSMASLSRIQTSHSSNETDITRPSIEPPRYDPSSSQIELSEQAPPYTSPVDATPRQSFPRPSVFKPSALSTAVPLTSSVSPNTTATAPAAQLPVLPAIQVIPFSPVEEAIAGEEPASVNEDRFSPLSAVTVTSSTRFKSSLA